MTCTKCKKYKATYTYNLELLCTKCYKKLNLCRRCGTPAKKKERITIDMSSFIDVCEHCKEPCEYCERCSTYHVGECPVIYNWRFKPTPRFIGTGKRYYGIELEFAHSENKYDPHDGDWEDRRKLAIKLHDTFGSNFYIKHDGSVRNGLEVVGHPMNKYKLFSSLTKEKFEKLTELGFINHESAGLHLHISKNSVHNLTIYKLYAFFSQHARKLYLSCGRTNEDWRRLYCRTVNKKVGKVIAKTKNETEKKIALRLTEHTIEMRVLGNSIDWETCIGRIQLYIFILEYATDKEIGAMGSWNTFLKELNKSKYKYAKMLKGLNNVRYNSETEEPEDSIQTSGEFFFQQP